MLLFNSQEVHARNHDHSTMLHRATKNKIRLHSEPAGQIMNLKHENLEIKKEFYHQMEQFHKCIKSKAHLQEKYIFKNSSNKHCGT